jgi:hippurate hydrolase
VVQSIGATAPAEYVRGYPVIVNHARETDIALKVATEVAGPGKANGDKPPITAAKADLLRIFVLGKVGRGRDVD